MPSLWSGSISFGLVSIPVRLETALTSRDLAFNFLHKECLQRINQKFYCATCQKYLERSDLVRGYEYEKDHYVVMNEEDFEKAEGESSRVIDVFGFVQSDDVLPTYLNRTYYVVPQEAAEKAYMLLLRGMQETSRVALARFVMRGKEYIGAIAPSAGGMLLHILFHKGEFKHIHEVIELPTVDIREKELQLAKQIIENLTDEFSEDMLIERYRERLMTIIRQKIEGKTALVTEQKRPAKVVDLMEALKRSLEATAPKKPATRISTPVRSEVRQEKKRKRA
ncbi:MAG: Ku protein [Acidobacteria bacterium]|nr:Ku protein [Acidobacteriota bacterium]